MRERLVDILKSKPYGYSSYEEFADYLLERGVIHLPYRIGDIVYQTDVTRIYELSILDISLHKNKSYYKTEGLDFDDDAIGKSIFLTREEAERALKEGAE